MKALWLATWFPDRIDFLNGDFIERHARAVATRMPVVVLYVAKDPSLIGAKAEVVTERTDNLIVVRGYYGMSSQNNGLFSKALSSYRYFKMYNRLYKAAVKEHGPFDVLHVQVAYRAGLYALWLKLTKGIKYVVTEHSSWFMPPTYLFKQQPFLTQWCTKKVLNNAQAVHVVSRNLEEQLKHLDLRQTSYTVIPNVVDTNAFYPSANTTKDPGTWQFATITGNVYQKNTDGAIRAFDAFLKKGYKAVLHVVGPNDNELKPLVKQLGIEANVVFHGAVTNAQVAGINRMCDAMLFFSRYETFGVAMTEAFCCGLPVIASRLDVIEENMVDGVNGLFVQSENEADLADKMVYFCSSYTQFNRVEIADKARSKYSYAQIALMIEEWYDRVLKA